MVESELSSSEKQFRFFSNLAHTASGLDPAGRVESLAYLLVRLSEAPRYEFRLTAGKPSSWSLLSDLGTTRWRTDFSLADPIDRISAFQVKSLPLSEDKTSIQLKTLLSGFDATKLDQLAGLVFVRDLLASTGRPTSDEAVVEKYRELIPEKSRPATDELPLQAARDVYALAA